MSLNFLSDKQPTYTLHGTLRWEVLKFSQFRQAGLVFSGFELETASQLEIGSESELYL